MSGLDETIRRLRLPHARAAGLATLWPILPGARVVGGAVRDMLAGRSVADLDLATPDRPDTVVSRLSAVGIKVVPTGIAHGTVTAVVQSLPFEITTLRRDVETDGRHAVVVYTDDWRADASRRDFTVNAMFLDAAGGLHDFFGGAGDLAARRVRFVGEASRRIAEDHLRILRFFRFQSRFGDEASPDAHAVEAIRAARSSLRTLSPERVWSELRRILVQGDPAASVRLMEATGVLAVLFGDAATPGRLLRLLGSDAPADPVLRLAALTGEDAQRLGARLRLAGAETTRLAAAAAPPAPDPEGDVDELRRLLASRTQAAVLDAAYLAESDGRRGDWASFRERVRVLVPPVFPLAGRDAVALGVEPGPAVGVALATVRDWWLRRGAKDGRADCLSALGRVIEKGCADQV